MSAFTLDQILPVVRDLAKRKANAFIRSIGPPFDEREDIQSDLVVAFITQWCKYDGTRASVRTFASRLMDNELTSILRGRLALRRQPCDRYPLTTAFSAETKQQCRIDIQRAIRPLPLRVRDTAVTLSRLSAVEAAMVLGCSRQMIGKRKRLIREALLSRGINGNYLSGKGV